MCAHSASRPPSLLRRFAAIDRAWWFVLMLSALLLAASAFIRRQSPVPAASPALTARVANDSDRLKKPMVVRLIGSVQRPDDLRLWHASLRGALKATRLSPLCDLRRIRIFRKTASGGSAGFVVNAELLLSAETEPDIELADGDLIFFPERLV